MFNSDDQPQATEVRRLPGAERTLTVSPLDLRQTKFATAMRGFDRAEVTAFLLEAADGYEQALRDNERLRQEIQRLEASLTQYRDLEGSLKSTLLNAQKVADDMKETAGQEAARLVREAEGRAELLMQKAQSQKEDVQREIDGLRMKRREAEASLESIIAALHNTVEFIRDQERHEFRVVSHRPATVAG
jgi:cell division initiation protein